MVVYDFTEYQITLWARGNQFAVYQKAFPNADG